MKTKTNSAQASLGVLVGAGVVALIAILVFVLGAHNCSTPAGYVGYVTRGAMFGKDTFVTLQTGPTSTGLGWMLKVINVSITPYTKDELFEGEKGAILAKDKLQVSGSVHTVYRINPDRIKMFVEQFSTLTQSGENPEKLVDVAYNNFLKEPLRTFARQAIEIYPGLEVNDHLQQIGQDLSAKVQAYVKDSPFEVSMVVIGNVQPPPEVSTAVAKKISVTQDLQRQDTENQIEEKKKERRKIEAEGIALAMDVINSQLTPAYIQYQAIEAQKACIGSPNHTIIYIPVGPMGVPIVGNLDLSVGAHYSNGTKSNATERMKLEAK